MKRKTRKIKNAFLKALTAFAWVMLVLAILGADSNPTAAGIIICVSSAWVSYFGWCNGWFGGDVNADF